jgi:cell division protein FtsQ
MTKLERELNQNRKGAEPSRARKRKLQRQNSPDHAMTAQRAGKTRQAARERATNRSSASIRERIVAAQIKVSTTSLPSLKGKRSSKLAPRSNPPAEDHSTQNQAAFNKEFHRRESRQRSESRRGETQYQATSRTETQRIHPVESGFQAKKNRRTFEARSDATPPVMVRGGMNGMAFGRVASSKLGKQKSIKRRIDVPLKVTGAEVRLPSLPFLHLGWRLVSLLMVLMMAASLVLVWKAPVFQVGSIEAKGLQRLTVSDLNAVMGTFGRSIFTLNPNLLNLSLQQAFPELSKVSVRVNLPASVKVVVTEREPVISWTQDGVETWVDAQGISFPPRGEPQTVLVKVEGHGTPPGPTAEASPDVQQTLPGEVTSPLTPNKTSLMLTTDLVSSILALGAKMPPDTTLVYDSEHGLGWNDPNGWEVFFGDEDQDMEMKLIVYQALVERLQSEGIQPVMISVEYVHAPYYRVQR